MAKWKKGFNPKIVEDALNEWIIQDGTQSQGSLKIVGFGFDRELVLLAGMLEFDRDIPESAIQGIVSRSVTKVAHRSHVKREGLLKEIGRQESLYLERPFVKYRLHTSISVSKEIKIQRVYFAGSYISVNGVEKGTVSKSRSKILNDQEYRTSEYYAPVAVTVAERTPDSAARVALDRLNYVRGLWNIQLNRRSFRTSFVRPEPVNKIVLGPVHTLHDMNGEIVADQFWYETSYQSPITPFCDIERSSYFQKYARNVLAIDKKHSYSVDLRRAVARYAEVLDSRDMNAVLLGLWGILEQLTDTQNKPYDVLIRRASFVFEDYKKAQEILRHIRMRRNQYAHGGSTTSYAEVLVHQLKDYVERLIGFHLGMSERFVFSDIAEFASMLDLPPAKEKLERKITLAELAHNIRHREK